MSRLRVSLWSVLCAAPFVLGMQGASAEVNRAMSSLAQPFDSLAASRDYYHDKDQDGVATRFDQCQASMQGVAVNQYGCELDSDGDGVYDRNDACPDTPAGRKVNFLGCQADTDGDGVLDFYDQCPGTPLGRVVNEEGCVPPVVVEPEPVVPLRTFVISHIVFDTGSYLIRADQRPVLERDAAQLQRLTESDVLLVTGFTDSHGSAEGNLQLSWNRAQSTKDYLTNTFNIPAGQIYILGMGEVNPIASNDTLEGRQQNRRIEFQVLSTDAVMPEGVRLVIPDEMKGPLRFTTQR
ncbi:OmpA family protein [Thiomicrospira microaerophila]|uniref:OmpA family protein n=1 Tax=Thiomicrospira microaerophila TaxID=406020 RepID=UPI0018E07C25|nr:OmpA family protein [Thiomicrospira microaerophila]